MNPLPKPGSRLLGLCVCVSLLVTVLTSSITPAQAQPSSNASGCATQIPMTALEPGAPPPCIPPSLPLTPPDRLTNYTGVPSATNVTKHVDPIDLRVLVISADSTEADLPAIKQALDFMGVPYTVYVATQTPGGLTPDTLCELPSPTADCRTSSHGYYEGVILTNGALASSGQSALSTAEWTNLSTYEAAFHIRQVTWYTYPTPDYGFNYPTAVVPYTSSLNATFTLTPLVPSGQTLFGSYVNTANPLTITGATTYLAQVPLTDTNTFPLLTDANGDALAVVHNYPDGRQNLALTFDSNAYLTHDLVLSYGLVNWVTKGLFLGERHVFLNPQVDDVLIDDETWPVGTPCTTSVEDPSLPSYRLSGSDFKAFVTWQQAKQKATTTAGLRTTMAFNGVGSTSSYMTNDTLTPQVKTYQGQFNWVNHSYDHEKLDDATYITATNEIQQNNKAARNLGLTSYSKQNMVNPEYSGLHNASFMQAAYDNGIRYVVTDTSRMVDTPLAPNAGIYSSLQPSILMIPRHPVNLYYNVGTPAQWLAEDNCLYSPLLPDGTRNPAYVSSYAQLLNRVSDQLLPYLLKGDIDPWMFHQTNMKVYTPTVTGTNSLLSDLMDATLAKYNNLFTLPVVSAQQGGSTNSLGDRIAKRMQYNAVIAATSTLTSTLASVQLGPLGFQVGQPFTLTMTAPSTLPYTQTSTLTVPVTGLSTSGAESYGGQKISHITLKPGQKYTVKGIIAGP